MKTTFLKYNLHEFVVRMSECHVGDQVVVLLGVELRRFSRLRFRTVLGYRVPSTQVTISIKKDYV